MNDHISPDKPINENAPALEIVTGDSFEYRIGLSQSGMLINFEFEDSDGRGYAFFIGRNEWPDIQQAVTRLFEKAEVAAVHENALRDLARNSNTGHSDL